MERWQTLGTFALCICAAITLFYFANKQLDKDKSGNALSLVFAAVFIFFCGLPWFQGLAKTWIISNVREKLQALGTNIDNVQATVATMQNELSNHQAQIDKHQTEINMAQGALRTNQNEIAVQQTNLAIAQTTIDTQQKQISDVQYFVKNLYSKTYVEQFEFSDTNRVFILQVDKGTKQLFLKLKYVPLRNSVEGNIDCGILTLNAFPVIMNSFRNFAHQTVTGDADLRNCKMQIRYVRDARETNLYQHIEFVGTDVFLDGKKLLLKSADELDSEK